MSTKAIRQAVVARLQGIDGPDDYVHDLSGAGQVVSGKHDRPASVAPFACVWVAGVDEQPGGPGATLTRYARTLTLMVRGWTAPYPKHPAARQDAAEDLLDDITAALRADKTLGGLVHYLVVSASPFEGDDAQSIHKGDHGQVLCVIACHYRES